MFTYKIALYIHRHKYQKMSFTGINLRFNILTKFSLEYTNHIKHMILIIKSCKILNFI